MPSLFSPLISILGYSQAAKPAPTAAATEAAIELSPFEVSTSRDTGYVGQDTLSGSRVRSNLKLTEDGSPYPGRRS